MTEILGTIVGRWYVTLFGIAFLVLARRHLGWRRTGIYALAAFAVGVAAENTSVHIGFPYTLYEFNGDLRGQELFAFDVPLAVTLSYTFMSYFAFASARVVVSGLRRTRGRMPVLEYVVAVLMGTWAVFILDPVSQRGEHFFLGDLFAYDGPGFWFGLPAGSQLGMTLVTAVSVGLLTWLMRDEPDEAVSSPLRHPRLGALAGFLGQVAFLATTAFVVARLNPGTDLATDLDALAGSAVLVWVPAGLMCAIHWRSMATDLR